MGSSQSSASSFKFGGSKRRLSQEFNSDRLINDREYYQKSKLNKSSKRPMFKKDSYSSVKNINNCHD
jgi:hypothetical protein